MVSRAPALQRREHVVSVVDQKLRAGERLGGDRDDVDPDQTTVATTAASPAHGWIVDSSLTVTVLSQPQ